MRAAVRSGRAPAANRHKEISMKPIICCLGMLAMFAGCDSSKVELESAKMNLANVTRDRDDLKVQMATLQQQLNTVRSDLEKEKATEAQATAGKASNRDGKAAMASKSTSTDTPAASKKKGPHKS